jgi:hypothetical protein
VCAISLTDEQIERYSRQIIVPGIGGRGQQRLLAARVLVVGDALDIEAPLVYLIGAGAGAVSVRVADHSARFSKKIAEMRQLNSEVSVRIEDEPQGSIDLALLILGSEAARKAANKIDNDLDARALVIARLDAPGKIAIIPNTQRPRIADLSMTASVGPRSEAADFIAMAATAEAFKLIAEYAENPSHTIIEFDGFETRVRVHP